MGLTAKDGEVHDLNDLASNVSWVSACRFLPPTDKIEGKKEVTQLTGSVLGSSYKICIMCLETSLIKKLGIYVKIEEEGGDTSNKSSQPKDAMACLNPKLVRANLELAKRNPKAMHPMSPSTHRSENKTVPQLHKVLNIECHLRAKALVGHSPYDLD